jgi:hypothetical protein
MAIIDAGHWETEHPVLKTVHARLTKEFAASREKVRISITRHKTSPIHFS